MKNMSVSSGAPPDLGELNAELEGLHPRKVLAWAFENIPNTAIAMSFQVGGLVNAFLAKDVVDRVPILFLQTGFHFPETLEFRDRIVSEWNLDLIQTTPTLGPERQAEEIHPELYKVDPDLCCQLNRVLPLQEILEKLDGWITGVRRDQGKTRRSTPVVEWQRLNTGKHIYKVNPLATWTAADVWRFAEENDIPTHPLYEQGYLSIGCAPCSRPAKDGEDERAGRWQGIDKAECGIHTFGGTAQEAALRAGA